MTQGLLFPDRQKAAGGGKVASRGGVCLTSVPVLAAPDKARATCVLFC